MKKSFLLVLCCLTYIHAYSQVNHTTNLYKKIKTLDSLLFNIGFNQCDISQFEKLVSENFEFYHDKGGTFLSKETFIKSIKECDHSPYKHRRELIESSLEIFPLEKSNVLYGAVETGIHRFYERKNDGPEQPGSTSKFTHLWLLENGEWKLSRVLTYDHLVKK